MALVFWWLPLLLGALLLLGGLFTWRRHTPRRPAFQKPLANSARLTRLPLYQSLVRRHRRLIFLLLGLTGVAIITTLLLSGRPAHTQLVAPNMKNRDIVLCLDVSGSMTEANKEITALYSKLAKDFNGERLGLVIFDSSPITLFPLTNDAAFISNRLGAISRIFGRSASPDNSGEGGREEAYRQVADLLEGVNQGDGSSLIGDGLAACVNRFDALDQKRTRSIILGTDNYLSGKPLITLQEAANLATERAIRVYGINPADEGSGEYKTPEAEAFKSAMLHTSGDYYRMDDPAAARTIIDKITAQDATRFQGSPQLIVADTPQPFIIVIFAIITILFGFLWRLRL